MDKTFASDHPHELAYHGKRGYMHAMWQPYHVIYKAPLRMDGQTVIRKGRCVVIG